MGEVPGLARFGAVMAAPAAPTLPRRALYWHRPLMVSSAAMAVLAVVALGGVIFDHRTLVGAPIWMKPFKFSLSFVAYGVTLAWMLSLLRQTPRAARWAGNLVTAAGVLEMVAIVGQVLRGRQSHFNVSTPFDAAVYGLMGITITALWLTSLGIAALSLRQPLGSRVTASTLRLGLGLALLGMAVAFLMVGPTRQQLASGQFRYVGAHSVGVPDGGPGLPVTGWSTVGGDLRVPHFVGLHALQVIPLVGLVLGVAGRRLAALRTERVRLGLVRVAAGGYGGLVALLTWQALRGQPLVHPDGRTLACFGLLAAAVLVAGACVLAVAGRTRLAVRPPPVHTGSPPHPGPGAPPAAPFPLEAASVGNTERRESEGVR